MYRDVTLTREVKQAGGVQALALAEANQKRRYERCATPLHRSLYKLVSDLRPTPRSWANSNMLFLRAFGGGERVGGCAAWILS
jgi:hypothetical protein